MQSASWPILDRRVQVSLGPSESSAIWPILDIAVGLAGIVLITGGGGYLAVAGLSAIATTISRR